jgi:hypothetical protein
MVVAEWVPDSRQLRDKETVEGAALTGAQEQQLRDIFALMDHDESQDLSPEEAKKALQAIDMSLKACGDSGAELDSIIDQMDRNKNGKIDFEEFKHAITRQSYYAIQDGRYFVLLSLKEAEALRGAIHIAKGQAGGMAPSSLDGRFLYGLALRSGQEYQCGKVAE